MGKGNRKKKSSPADPPPTGEETPPDISEDQPAMPEGQMEEGELAEPPRTEGEESVEQTPAPPEELATEAEVIEQAPDEVEPVGESAPEGISKAEIEKKLGMKLPKEPVAAALKLAAALIEIRKERDEEVDKWKRIAAEYDNSRKRSERESRELLERERQRHMELASERVMLRMLHILDALDSAIAQASDVINTQVEQNMYKGMVGVRHLLLEVMESEGLIPVEAAPGTPFDPKVHEAVERVEVSSEATEGSYEVVKAEVQRGYQYQSGRVLQYSKVVVESASPMVGEEDAESLAEEAADVGDGAVASPDDSVSVEAEDGGGPEEGETPVDED